MTGAEAKKDVVRRAWAAYDQGHEDAFLACLAENWKEYGGDGADSGTAQTVLSSMRLHRSAFPDKKTTIAQWVVEGDLVVARSVTTATHKGRYIDVEPTGKQLRTHEISIHRVVDGKIVETWYESGGGFYRQLTGRPAPVPADNIG
jgi:predicted ester cyclase